MNNGTQNIVMTSWILGPALGMLFGFGMVLCLALIGAIGVLIKKLYRSW